MNTQVRQGIRQLVNADRCDRCGAQAKIELAIPVQGCTNPLVFKFCGHHFTEHADKLRTSGAIIIGSLIAPE